MSKDSNIKKTLKKARMYYSMNSYTDLFKGCENLEELKLNSLRDTDIDEIDGMCEDCSSLKEIDMTNIDTSNMKNLNNTFKNCSSLDDVNLSNWDTRKVKTGKDMFANVPNLNFVPWNYDGFNYENFTLTETDTSYQYVFPWKDNPLTITLIETDSENAISTILPEFTPIYEVNGPIIYKIFKLDGTITSDLTTPKKDVTKVQFIYDEDSYSKVSFNGLTDIKTIENLVVNDKWTDMSGIFYSCHSLTKLDTTGWDTSNVINMNRLFSHCTSLESLDISTWNTDKVTSMKEVFSHCETLETIDISGWNTSNVTDMFDMFAHCYNLKDISLPNRLVTNTCSNIQGMFIDDYALKSINTSNWDTSNITHLYGLFSNCRSLSTLDLSSFDLRKATSHDGIFTNCSSSLIVYYIPFAWTQISLSDFNVIFKDVSNIYTITSSSTFELHNYYGNGALTDWGDGTVNSELSHSYSSPGNYIVKTNMIHNQSAIPLIREASIGKVTPNIKFTNASLIEKVDFTRVMNKDVLTDITAMFSGCSSLTTAYISNINAPKDTNVESLFTNVPVITDWGFTGNNYETWDIYEVASDYCDKFPWNSYIEYSIVPEYDDDIVSRVHDESSLKKNYSYFPYIGEVNGEWPLDLKDFTRITLKNGTVTTDIDNTLATDVASIRVYYNTRNTENIDFSYVYVKEINNMNITSAVKSLSFAACRRLEAIHGNNWDTSGITSFNQMFYLCDVLTTIDGISNWDTSNVTDMRNLFMSSPSIQSLDLSNWDTSNVIYMSYMFYQCNALTSLNLSNWDTNKVTDTSSMFLFSNKNIEWSYNGNNYSNFTLDEEGSNYDGIFPWNLAYIEYTLNGQYSTNDVVTQRYSTSEYLYLPRLYKKDNTNYVYPTANIILTLKDGTETEDLTNTIANISKIRVNFSKRSVPRLCFYGSTSTSTNRKQYVGTVERVVNSKFKSMAYMFYYCRQLQQVNLSDIDFSDLTETSNMFYYCTGLKSIDLANANMPSITEMDYMFYYCSSMTTANLSNLNAPVLTNIQNLFTYCKKMTSANVSNLNAPKLEKVNGMFQECNAITAVDLTNFNTSKVTSMDYMFYRCYKLTSLDTIFNWDISKVTTMQSMFYECETLTSLDLSKWDTSSVTNIGSMFDGCINLTSLDVSNFDTSKVTDFYCIFQYCRRLTSLDLSSWVTNNATRIYQLFSECSALKTIEGISNWNTDKVTNMYGIFYYCSNLKSLDLTKWKTDLVTDLGSLFCNAGLTTIEGISNWNTSNVTKMYGLFYGVNVTSLDLSRWDVRKVTDMKYLFYYCDSLTSLNLSNWNTSSATGMDQMFGKCYKLTSLDLSSFTTNKVTTMKDMFNGCSSLQTLDISNFDTSKVTSYSGMFTSVPANVNWNYNSQNGSYSNFLLTESQTGYSPNVFPWTYQPVEFTITPRNNTDYLNTTVNGEYVYLPKFYDGSAYSIAFQNIVITKKDGSTSSDFSTTLAKDVEKIEVRYNKEKKIVIGSVLENTTTPSQITSITKLYTDRQTDMSKMFCLCSNLISVCNFNVTNLVTDMSYMFYKCSSLNLINTLNWDTSNVTDMTFAFSECENLTSLDLSNWDTSNVTSLRDIFGKCYKLTTLNVSNWDTSSVTNMQGIFYYCTSLTTLDVSNWDTSSVTNMHGIFDQCISLISLDVSNWDTSSVNIMYHLFHNCKSLTSLDLSGWDTGSVYDMYCMFRFCSSLTSLDLSGWDTGNVTVYTDMFDEIPKLTAEQWGYDGTNYMDWTLTESETSYSGKFPWSETYIEYTMDTTDTEPLNFIGWDGISPNLPALHKKSGGFVYNYNSVIITKKDGSTTSDLTTTINNIQKVRVYYDLLDTIGIFFNYSDGLTHTPDGSGSVNPSIKTLDYLDVSRFTTFSNMFSGCTNLVSVNTSNWVNNKVTSMAFMFDSCISLTSIDLSGIDTSNVTDIRYMFSNCSSLTNINLSGWKINKSVSVEYSFYNVPTDTSSWVYDDIKFIPLGPECGFGTDFPWPSVTTDIIDFTLSGTTLPTFPEYFTEHSKGSTYYFAPRTFTYNSTSYTGLMPRNSRNGGYNTSGVNSTVAWNCYKIVAPITGQLQVNLINYAENSYDYTILNLKTSTYTPSTSSTTTGTSTEGLFYHGKGKSTSSSYQLNTQTGVTNITEGTTYYLYIHYYKNSSSSKNMDAGLIKSIVITDDEANMISEAVMDISEDPAYSEQILG